MSRIGSFAALFAALIVILMAPGLSCSSGGGGGGLPPEDIEAKQYIITPDISQELLLEEPVNRLLAALDLAGYGSPKMVAYPPKEIKDLTIFIGTQDDPLIKDLYQMHNLNPPDLEVDGLRLDGFKLDDGRRIGIICGNGPRGAVYAIYELIRQLTVGLDYMWDGFSFESNPAFTVRYTAAYSPPNEPHVETPLMDPVEILRMGYNGIILYGLTDLCTFDDYDPDLFDPEFYWPYWPYDLRGMVEADRAYVTNLIEIAKEYHLEVFLDGDMLVVPSTAFIKYEQELSHDNEPYVLCPGKPKVWEIIEATIDEIFYWFPDIDGIQIRSGEVYSFKQTVVGNNPTEGSCPSCEHLSDEDKLRLVTTEIKASVIGKYGKRFNQRAWGYLNTWHSVPELYIEISNPVPTDPKLTFSFKQPRTDYWRYNSLNPNFGLGFHQQWAEFQCQREYEGKGAFPLYMGRYFAEGGPECIPMGLPVGGIQVLQTLGVNGGWGWCRGGGWGGPHIEREEWVALNDYALGRLFWEPDLDPYDIAREWLTLDLGKPPRKEVENAFIEILKLSEDALMKARYVKPFAEGDYAGLEPTNGWSPCLAWLRDDKINDKALKIAEKLYESHELLIAIAEKQELLALCHDLLKQWAQLIKYVEPDDTYWEELYHTAIYGDSIMRLSAHYFLAAFHYVQWKYSPTSEAQQSALYHLAQWDEQWVRHQTEIPTLTGVATPFQDNGMVELCDSMYEHLTR